VPLSEGHKSFIAGEKPRKLRTNIDSDGPVIIRGDYD